MGSYEATNVVLAKVKNFEPEYASKIMGYLLINLDDSELVRLACSPDHVLHSLVLRVKSHLGFSLSSPPLSPSLFAFNPNHHNNGRTQFNNHNPFSKMGALDSIGGGGAGVDFNGNFNPASPNSQSWKLSGFPNNPICSISPKSSPLLSYDNIRAGSSFSPRVNVNVSLNGGGSSDSGGDGNNNVGDFVDEQQVNEFFPFLNESSSSSKNDDYRRSFSCNDAFFGFEEGGGSGSGFKPCLYFAKGFCKNGSNCKFVHGGLTDSFDGACSGGAIVGSPSKFEGLEQREEFMRLKAAAHHQRLVAASQFMAGASSPSSYDKYIDFLMQQQNDPQRAAAAAAFMMGEEFYNFGGRGRLERNEFLAMLSADKPNSASRQIYLTFPAESTFKDEDVSEYFSKFGPVQDVRIPYQQKRMFGFVTFVYPETVRLILSKGNPHFICDSRVLVKPYKEKGKIPDKRQQHQQQQLERGDFSPCLSPSGFDSKEPHDFHLGGRMLYTPHDVLLRRKFEEEQAELRQAIELQGRRLNSLQLPDIRNIPINHHQRSLSVGAPFSLPDHFHSHIGNTGLSPDSMKGDITGTGAEEQRPIPQKEVDSTCIGDTVVGNGNGSANAEVKDLAKSVEQALPDSLFASPTKATGDNRSDFSTLAEINESAAFPISSPSHNKLESPTPLNEMASH